MRVRLRELAVGVAQRVVRVLRGRPEGVVEHVRAEKRRLGVREHQRLRRRRLAASVSRVSRRRDVPRREGGGRRRGDPPRGALPPPRAPVVHVGVQREGDAPQARGAVAPCVARQARRRQEVPPRLFAVEPELQREALREVLPRAGQARVPRGRVEVQAQAADRDVLGEPLGVAVRFEQVRERRDARALGPDVRARRGGRETLDRRKSTAHVERIEGCAPSAPRMLRREDDRGDGEKHEERRARDGRAGGGGAQLVRRLRPRKSSGRITLDAVSLPRRRSRPATCQRRSDAPDEAQGHRRARRRGGDVQGRTLELAHHAAREAPSDVRRSRCVVSVVSS